MLCDGLRAVDHAIINKRPTTNLNISDVDHSCRIMILFRDKICLKLTTVLHAKHCWRTMLNLWPAQLTLV